MNRTAGSFLNLLSSTGASVILLTVSIFTTPWLLQLLGTEQYGAARALNDLMGYILLLEFGLGPAIRGELAVALGRGDQQKALNILATGTKAYRWPMLAMFASGLVLTALIPRFIPVQHTSVSALYGAGFIMMVPYLFIFYLPFRGLAEAMNKSYLSTGLITVQILVTTALSLLFAYQGWGVQGQAAAQALSQLPVAIFFMIFATRHYPSLWRTPTDPPTRKALWRMNWHNFSFNASSRIALVSDNLIVSWALGAAAVSPFFLTQRLLSIMAAQLQQISNSTWAPLAQLYSAGDVTTFRHRFLQLSSATSGIGIATLGVILAYNHHFLARWVGSTMYAGDPIAFLAAGNAWFLAVYSLWVWPFSGCSLMDKLSPYATAAMVLNISISFAATALIGAPGPLVGTFTTNLLLTGWAYSKLLDRHFGISPGELWTSVLRHFLWGIPFGGVIWFLSHSHTPSSWIALGAETTGCTVVGLCLWWLLGTGQDDRSFWQMRARTFTDRFIGPRLPVAG